VNLVRTIIAIVAAFYAGTALLLYLLQDRFLFFPTRDLHTTPDQRGLPYEDVDLVADDGVRIHGWFVAVPRPRATVLFFHGNGGNLAHTIEAIETFARLGLDVFAIDYRGYGRSEGTPSGDGILRDADAAWKYLVETRSLSPSQIILVGRSLGGGPASTLAAKHRPAGLVLESTYSSVPDRAAELFPWLPARWIAKVRFDNRANLANVFCPVLIVHSSADETIPFAHAERLYAAANEPKELVTIGHGHNDGFALSAEIYVAALRAFFERVVGE
jgi:fermentation-respiration switch protein FrsA (DUF1100 family)